jgi:hypothetical protein
MALRENRKSAIVEVGDEEQELLGFSKRLLLSLVVDVSQLIESAERVQVQVFTLAKELGITPPT